jgi:hypothetical protein
MKVDNNFRPVYLKPLTGNRFEGYHLSSVNMVERIKVQKLDHRSPARCSEEFLQGLMSGRTFGQPGLLIGVASSSLPKEQTKWLDHAGLTQDLHEWAPEVVLCSHLHTVKGNNWSPGLLIDGTSGEKDNPYFFSGPLVRTVTKDLVVHPYQTVFLNFSHPNGKPLSGLEQFTFLAYAIGYLKFSSNDLDFECKKNLGNEFLKNAVRRLPEKERKELLILMSTATAGPAASNSSRPISGEYRRRPTRA